MFQPDHTPSQRGGPAEENFQFSGEPIGTHRCYLALALDQTDEIVFTDFIDDLIAEHRCHIALEDSQLIGDRSWLVLPFRPRGAALLNRLHIEGMRPSHCHARTLLFFALDISWIHARFDL